MTLNQRVLFWKSMRKFPAVQSAVSGPSPGNGPGAGVVGSQTEPFQLRFCPSVGTAAEIGWFLMPPTVVDVGGPMTSPPRTNGEGRLAALTETTVRRLTVVPVIEMSRSRTSSP